MPREDDRRKRKLTETPEPPGQIRRRGRRPVFVVQKHAARRLHYDFRLAINGVLVSWAVPKGPSMNPADRRLAIRTEDHPLEYADFEGVIPEGQYGAGIVMVWDTGAYEPEGGLAPDEQLARGKIDMVLHGHKLRGGFTLVQAAQQPADPEQGRRWFLIKHRDEYADPTWDIESPELDRSVRTGRTLQEIEESRPASVARCNVRY
jgi:bifunctional non-homologous end joining protein LigD